MNSESLMDVATVVANLKMYPYFDVAHYILMCMAVREDMLSQSQGQGAGPSCSPQSFSRKHPLSSWLSSMLLCFSGSLIANFLLGEPVITPFKDHQNIITASAVWYLVNFCPFDIVYKLCKLLPFQLAICVLKEIHRAHSVYHGVLVAKKLYPTAYVIIVLVGTIKGAGSGLMKNMDRLVRGVWIPGSNEILQPTFTTKASFVASIIFLCERLNVISVPHSLIYFGIVMFLVYFKISSVVLGIHDPFVPLENLFCALFMGGLLDAVLKTISREPIKQDENRDPSNNTIKTKDAKKKE